MQTKSLAMGSTHDVEVSDSVTVLEMDDRPAAPLLYPPVVSRNTRKLGLRLRVAREAQESRLSRQSGTESVTR